MSDTPFVQTAADGTRYHLTLAAPRRVVPAHERHKWHRIPKRGQTAQCLKCGCVKCYRLDYDTVYRLKGSTEVLQERPACSRKPELIN